MCVGQGREGRRRVELQNVVSRTTLERRKKSRIQETLNLSTDADRRTNTILESLRDLFRKKGKEKWGS